jgi:hypothetical protein
MSFLLGGRRGAAARAAAGLSLSVALTGCSTPGYDHVALALVNSGTTAPEVQLSSLSVTVPEGVVVEISATPMSAEGPLGGDFTFDLTSSDATVLGVQPALGQPAGAPVFVVFGASAGTAEIQVLVNGEAEAPIAATVVMP